MLDEHVGWCWVQGTVRTRWSLVDVSVLCGVCAHYPAAVCQQIQKNLLTTEQLHSSTL